MLTLREKEKKSALFFHYVSRFLHFYLTANTILISKIAFNEQYAIYLAKLVFVENNLLEPPGFYSLAWGGVGHEFGSQPLLLWLDAPLCLGRGIARGQMGTVQGCWKHKKREIIGKNSKGFLCSPHSRVWRH